MVSCRRTVGVKGAMLPASSSTLVHAAKRISAGLVFLALYFDDTLSLEVDVGGPMLGMQAECR